MEMKTDMAINHKPQLSPKNFHKLQEYVEFNADFHHFSIRAQNEPEQKWHDLPYLATDDMVAVVLGHWPTDWHTFTDLTMGSSKFLRTAKEGRSQVEDGRVGHEEKKGGRG